MIKTVRVLVVLTAFFGGAAVSVWVALRIAKELLP